MRLTRLLGAVLGVTGVLAIAGCGGDPQLDALAGPEPSLKPLESPQRGGFDECGLVALADITTALGVDAVHITSREVLPEADGGRLAGCSYFTEDVPGIAGMTINTVAGTDRERFFAPFAERDARPQPDFGDYAEVVAYRAGSVHFREVRVLEGTTGVHVRYTYNNSPGGMPNLDDDRLAALLGGTILSAVKALPPELDIADGSPEGPCADIDLAQASRVLGGELTASRAVLGSGGAMNCQFAGAEASLGVVVVTDPGRVEAMGAPEEVITAPDIGDGALLQILAGDEGPGPLDATVTVDDRLVLVVADYGDGAGTVAAPRPEDEELVRAIVSAVT